MQRNETPLHQESYAEIKLLRRLKTTDADSLLVTLLLALDCVMFKLCKQGINPCCLGSGWSATEISKPRHLAPRWLSQLCELDSSPRFYVISGYSPAVSQWKTIHPEYGHNTLYYLYINGGSFLFQLIVCLLYPKHIKGENNQHFKRA